MSGLQLTLENAPRGPLDLSPISPTSLAGKTPDQIRRLRLRSGSKTVAAGDLFSLVEGDPQLLSLSGLTHGCYRVGANLEQGFMTISGNVGEELGREMSGGRITLKGHAGDGVGLGMTGGAIVVSGNAGDRLGGALPGATRGMNNGTIVVRGNVGNHCGERMRRGVIMIGGAAGAFLADRMIAGTIVVLGLCADAPGIGMRRGTLMLALPPERLPATFNSSGTLAPGFIKPLEAFLSEIDARLSRRLRHFAICERWCGDMAFGGKGELLIPSSGGT